MLRAPFNSLKLLKFRFKLLRTFLILVKDPTKTDTLFSAMNGGVESEAMRICLASSKRDPRTARLIDERHLAPLPDMDRLSRLATGTLGRAYFEFMKENKIVPDFYIKTIPPLTNDARYLQIRGRQTHDIWHVVLGYSTSYRDEIALQAFSQAQIDTPISAFLFAVGFLHTLIYSPRDLRNLTESIIEGWKRGNACKPFLAEKWEEQWEDSLESIRIRLGVEKPSVPSTKSTQATCTLTL